MGNAMNGRSRRFFVSSFSSSSCSHSGRAEGRNSYGMNTRLELESWPHVEYVFPFFEISKSMLLSSTLLST